MENMSLRKRATGWLGCLLLVVFPALSLAQDLGQDRPGVLLEMPNLGPIPGGSESTFGSTPGALDGGLVAPDTSGMIGGRPRGGGRIPKRAAKGKQPTALLAGRRMGMDLPAPLSAAEISQPRQELLQSVLPSEVDDEGPPDGMSLDDAIQRLMHHNLDLLAIKLELTQADADIITAGLRANPLLYGDSQFLTYQPFTDARPGGPTQYDVNVTWPLDISHKRRSRVEVAQLARHTLTAQFQDVARRQIANVYKAFVDLQAARQLALSAEISVRAQEASLKILMERPPEEDDDIDQFTLQLENSRLAMEEAKENYQDAREVMGLLLSIDSDEAAQLEPRGSLRDHAPSPPPIEHLVQMALEHRPDLAAARRGVGRAGAEITLARANRFEDVFLFYDPYSYQDLSWQNKLSARSWGIGLTVALPLFNRNQGNIARAHANFSQTQLELTSLERRVVSETRLAYREYSNSRSAVDRIDSRILPIARRTRKKVEADFKEEKISLDDYLSHLEDESDTARQYRDAQIRHRRSMLDLNTAVGCRILP